MLHITVVRVFTTWYCSSQHRPYGRYLTVPNLQFHQGYWKPSFLIDFGCSLLQANLIHCASVATGEFLILSIGFMNVFRLKVIFKWLTYDYIYTTICSCCLLLLQPSCLVIKMELMSMGYIKAWFFPQYFPTFCSKILWSSSGIKKPFIDVYHNLGCHVMNLCLVQNT